MLFRLLGPVEVVPPQRPLDAGPPQQRAVLASLLADPGRLVAAEALIDRVWGEAPPPAARSALHAHIARIKRLLAAIDGSPATLTARSGGYAVHVEPGFVDLHRFRLLLEEARTDEVDAERRVALLREALALWRGEALAGVPGPWAARVRQDWGAQRLEAVAAWAGAELAIGDPHAVVEPLAELVAEHPLTEPLWTVLIRALHESGRKAEALQRYADLRKRLADELGADPGTELQELHRAILRDRPVSSTTTAPPRVHSVPAQLPTAVAGFAGRHNELARLDAILAGHADTPTAIAVTAVSGTAGVGKTALAVHWAHRVAERFPDGQLYVNLRGFDASGSVVAPSAVVRQFLDALGVPPQRVPADPDAQVSLYRTSLAGKRVLVVLDNARDPDQVRPLLPGAPGCVVVITSRHQLTGLVAAEGAHHLALDLLPAEEARGVLAQRLGRSRLDDEPAAVDEIISACARLPLALAIVAARAEVARDLPLAVLAGQLREGDDRLEALSTGDDPRTDLRVVFSWSYGALSPEAARLFRLLGLHPGPDLSAPAAASLAGITRAAARPLLAELIRASLLTEATSGRYVCHDLLRDYATQLAGSVDTDEQRHAAVGRILDHYLHTAHPDEWLLYSSRDPLPLPARRPGVTPEPLGDSAQAWEWFAAENQVLRAAVGLAATAGFDTHTWQLATVLATFLDRKGLWHEWTAVATEAVAATQRLGDPAVQAAAHRGLAGAHLRLGRLDDAHTQLHQALELAARAGDRTQQALAHVHLAYLWERRGGPERALHHARQGLELYQAIGHKAGQAQGLNTVGWYHALLGEHEQAFAHCRQALPLLQQLGDRMGQAATWDSLGYSHRHLGRFAEAVSCYEQAVTFYRDSGARYEESATLTRLGDTHLAAGDPRAASKALRQALLILEDLDHPDAESVRATLAAVQNEPVS